MQILITSHVSAITVRKLKVVLDCLYLNSSDLIKITVFRTTHNFLMWTRRKCQVIYIIHADAMLVSIRLLWGALSTQYGK